MFSVSDHHVHMEKQNNSSLKVKKYILKEKNKNSTNVNSKQRNIFVRSLS